VLRHGIALSDSHEHLGVNIWCNFQALPQGKIQLVQVPENHYLFIDMQGAYGYQSAVREFRWLSKIEGDNLLLAGNTQMSDCQYYYPS